MRDLYAEDFDQFGYSLALEDATEAPGDLIACGRLVASGTELEPGTPRQSELSAALRNALRIRRLVDRHLL